MTTISEELTCIVCMEIIFPPIRMCSNAHNICNICSIKVALHAPRNCWNDECGCHNVVCPMCRVDIKGTISSAVTRIVEASTRNNAVSARENAMSMRNNAASMRNNAASMLNNAISMRNDAASARNNMGAVMRIALDDTNRSLYVTQTINIDARIDTTHRLGNENRELPLRNTEMRTRYNIVDEPYSARRLSEASKSNESKDGRI
jgi:uncharacterized Zn finger protein (UPF0148 family)